MEADTGSWATTSDDTPWETIFSEEPGIPQVEVDESPFGAPVSRLKDRL